jgi:hypothetical protein
MSSLGLFSEPLGNDIPDLPASWFASPYPPEFPPAEFEANLPPFGAGRERPPTALIATCP